MKHYFISSVLLIMVLFACKTPTPKDLSQEILIPKPSKVVATGSSFELTEKTTIYIQNESLETVAEYLVDFLEPSTGFKLEIKKGENKKGINLALKKNKELGKEGYSLVIKSKQIELSAADASGIFRGMQTLRQLLPARIEKRSLQQGPWEVASGTIEDKPKYEYRGVMLDVARHFFGVEDVKRYIDLAAAYKMNVLHLHLTDDQGWRIEIKKWPKLTTVGGANEVGGGKGGFYTQDQYREIVEYAQSRFMMVVPEIDMPGHTNAALSAYAELNENGRATKPYTGIDVGFSSLATQKEITYQFIDDVLTELVALTPGPYIHIGGDESHATKKEDYIAFINRVQKMVNGHGKQMLGWADVAAAKLEKNSVAQFWQKEPKNALKAVKQGVKVLMSPATRAYMDMQYDSICPLGLHWSGYVEVDKAYNWDLETNVKGIGKENILGIEAPLWTETIKTMDDIEFMVFPRLPGYAEIGWYTGTDKTWEEYKVRLGKHSKRMKAMDINFYKSKLVDWQ